MQAILQVLEADWQQPFRCTNLEQAADRAGLAFRDAHRRQLARTILNDPRLAGLLRWHPSAYVLTNEERLVARAVLYALRGAAREDALARRVCTVLSAPGDRVRAALDALTWIGFLERDRSHVHLSPEAPRFLEGVGFYFHEVGAGKERFNVNCFHDFALLTSPTYRARRLRNPTRRSPDLPGMTPKMLAFLGSLRPEDLFPRTYDRGTVHLQDACAQCMRRIRLTVADGRLVGAEPAGAWYVRGGGCGVNHLFCGAGCAEQWVRANPRLGDPERGPVEALW